MNGNGVAGWFFDGWDGPIRVVLVGTSAYLALILVMRVSGNRTLSKMNAFDFIVTVALGSTLATVLLSKGTDLAEGVTALVLLVLLQWLITRLSTWSSAITRLVKSEPILLVRGGEMLTVAMRRARVIESDVRQAARESGLASIDLVDAMVLETDGSFSVITNSGEDDRSALANLDRDLASRKS
jgi:uncharacterized membrane protein YcaP (DUF421 family)